MPGLLRAVVLVSGWIGRAHDRWRARVAGRFSLRAEIGALQEGLRKALAEVRLLRERFERLDSHRRPMYLPQERLEILAHAQRYGMSIEAICNAFLVSDQTILNWRAELGLDKSRVVQSDTPMSRLPDLVRHIAAKLKREWPSWGTRRIAGILARLGLKASRSSVQRILKRPPKDRPSRSNRTGRGPLVAKRTGQIVLVDFTRVSGLFRSVWVGAVVDAFSRKVLALRAVAGPSGAAAVALVRDAVRREGRPVWVVTDQGAEFTCGKFTRFLRRHGIRRRFGAPGKKQSTSIVERYWRSLKTEFVDPMFVYRSLPRLNRDLDRYREWFSFHRPHWTFRGRAPGEIEAPEKHRKPREVRSARLLVSHLGGDRRLPVLRLRRAA